MSDAAYQAAWRKRVRAWPPVGGAAHGTRNRYNNYGCRCEQCRDVEREYRRAWVARARSRDVPEHVHGTFNGYNNYGCRCQACTHANRATSRRYRAKRAGTSGPKETGGGS